MKLNQRIDALAELGGLLSVFAQKPEPDPTDRWALALEMAVQRAFQHNPWFTADEVRCALGYLGEQLTTDGLTRWMEPYAEKIENQRTRARVGIVMAGNIPAVGFHDLLCVMLAGHRAEVKLSSADAQLMPCMLDFLKSIHPGFAEQVIFTDRPLKAPDAVIATGSNNSSRYFESYFAGLPHIIRKHRNSVAVLTGAETPQELQLLCDDIFRYFGLGCRSVSALLVPANYDFSPLLKASEHFVNFATHHKYASNYMYYKTIFIMNKVVFTDNGILMLSPNEAYSSPVSVVHYASYSSVPAVNEKLRCDRDQLQCIVSISPEVRGAIRPGQAQFPALNEYADGVDTMAFLTELSTFAGT